MIFMWVLAELSDIFVCTFI